MSIVTPTILPRPQVFPHLLPKPPQPYPTPLPPRRIYGHLNARRDLQREMEDLSDEEGELDELVSTLRRATQKKNFFQTLHSQINMSFTANRRTSQGIQHFGPDWPNVNTT
jgi:hypothetical protein